MRYLRNLISLETQPCQPWLFNDEAPAAVRGKDGKKARDAWINNPSTDWQVWSAWEGLNECLRISSGKDSTDGNPPFKLYALVGDYDAPVSDAELQSGVERMGEYVPNHMERTLSGNSRFTWEFEQGVTFPSKEFAVAFLKHVQTVIKFDLLSVKFDRPAFEDPARYWTNGGKWYEISDQKIPVSKVLGWVFEVAKKFKWDKSTGIEIPLSVVWPELQKKYPLHGWPTEFALESQGPTFWIPESTSPKSAIVKATGIYTFSQSAPRPFWSWCDLLGAEFCESYKTNAIGKAVEGIYHDGKNYLRKDGAGTWRAYTKEDTRDHLVISRMISGERYKGAPSEADEALEFIRHYNGVDGAAPFVFQKYGLYDGSGGRYLNTHTRRVLSPSEEASEWGPNGRFPWLSAYFDHLFTSPTLADPKEQLPFFLAWLKRFYASAHCLELDRGQNMFLIGKAGTGKTLLSQNIMTKMLGGSAEAQAYLLGETDFNSQLFSVALWTVDDNSSTISAQKHAKFSSMVKKLSSNQTFEYHAKFRVPAAVVWLGRVVVTANDDEESLRIIPDMEISAKEKTMLFRVNPEPVVFPPAQELETIFRRELPSFCRWLLDWTPPQHVVGLSRYGVARYHEPSLLRQAENSSRSNAFSEVLDDWFEEWCNNHPKEQYWEGTGFALLRAFNKEDDRRSAVRDLTVAAVNRGLSALKGKGHQIEASDANGPRVWRIRRATK